VRKLPIPKNEKERLRALNNYGILNSLSEEEYNRITELASLICEVPISLISLIDEKRQWFKSKVGIDVSETARELAFCQYAIMDSERFDVKDATLDDRFKDNPFVRGEPNIKFYAGQPLIDAKGYALGTLCVLDNKPRELNDSQKKALEILAKEVMSLIVGHRQREELGNFETIFNLSNDLVFIGGTDGYFKKINPAFERLLGWDEKYLLSTSHFEFIHPDDIERTENELKKLSEGYNTINFEQRFKTKSGEYKTLQWVSSPEKSTGNIFGIGRDITDIKDKEQQLAVSERKLRSFFEDSQGFMCTHDLRGNFLSVNSSGAQALGYTTEEILQRSLFDIVPKGRHPLVIIYLEKIKTTGRADGEMTTVHKDGSIRIWMFNNILEYAADGQDYVIGNGSDVTERHKLEKDLRYTKKILEQTNKVARVGGWEVDVKEQEVNWTDETKYIFGVVGNFMPDLAASISFYKEGESRDKIKEAINLAIKEGEGWDLEVQITKMDGEDLWVRTIGNAEFENGKCKRIFGTLQDIDNKKKAELEVIASRKFLKDILQASNEVSIVATDTKGLITVFNSGAEKILGYTADEMIGKQTTNIFRLPEEVAIRKREVSEEFGREIEGFRVFAERADRYGSEQREWTGVRKDGSRVLISSVVMPIRDDRNNVIGYLSIAHDITIRKKIEQALITEKARLAAFVEHAPAAVAMLDTDMCYVAASNFWLETFEQKNRKIIGVSYYDTFLNLSADRMERHQKVLNGDVERTEEDVIHLTGSDEDKFISWEMRPWYHYDGKIGGMMISVQDITAAVKHREELKAAKLLAEQASIAKSDFLASMSHEIRTPLNGVIGFTDLVLKTNLNETQRQYLNVVSQSASGLLGIINDILDFSKIEAGKLELDIEKCDLYELGCQAIDIITYQVQTKGLEMLLNISPDLPRFIWADSLRLKQVLVNLLGNATKFTEKGEIELKIEVLSTKGNKTKIRFAVRDTGIGIKPEQQSKIFQAFSQEDPSTTKKYGGTGLGLTISNRLLELMNSELQLKSAPGMGSTFYFELTLKTEKGEPIEWENIDLIKKVLVVDDNENNRMIISQMLLLKQIKTVETSNGHDALKLLSKGEQFDVLIIDYNMPEMDGLQTIRKIREIYSKSRQYLPVILLYSSADDGRIIKECDELKVQHRLVKPVKMQDIYNTLSRLHVKEKNISVGLSVKKIVATPDKLTILIADDNSVNMLLAKTILKRIAPNAFILEAKTGIEAINNCNKRWPDLIFMDVQMPEMNGYEATKEIRAMQGDRWVPIIALTAGNVKGEKEKCLEAGMDDFAVKPIVEDALAAVFNKWIYNIAQHSVEVAETGENDQPVHFDIKTLKSYIGDDEDVISELINLTKVELVESLSILEGQVGDHNLKAINLTGHKLYGTCVSAGLPELAKIANQFEHMPDFVENDVRKLLAKAAEEIEVILSVIRI